MTMLYYQYLLKNEKLWSVQYYSNIVLLSLPENVCRQSQSNAIILTAVSLHSLSPCLYT